MLHKVDPHDVDVGKMASEDSQGITWTRECAALDGDQKMNGKKMKRPSFCSGGVK